MGLILGHFRTCICSFSKTWALTEYIIHFQAYASISLHPSNDFSKENPPHKTQVKWTAKERAFKLIIQKPKLKKLLEGKGPLQSPLLFNTLFFRCSHYPLDFFWKLQTETTQQQRNRHGRSQGEPTEAIRRRVQVESIHSLWSLPLLL